MLPEIGATELMVIAAVALIVVGPKDLPVLLRKLGQFVARLRGMANDFRSSFDEMARQSELDDLRKEVAAMRSGQYAPTVDDGQVSQVFNDIDAELRNAPTYDPFSAADYPSPDAALDETPAPKPKRVRKPKTTVELIESPPATKAAPRKTAAPKASTPKASTAKPVASKATAPKAPARKAPAKSGRAKA